MTAAERTFTIAPPPDDFGRTGPRAQQPRLAPLPLGHANAVRRALQLRRLGWSYPTIAGVMGMYHGVWLSASSWRNYCVQVAGDSIKSPRGVSIATNNSVRKAAA